MQIGDVGGGFGLKSFVGREEIVITLAAHELGAAIKWSEDRRENLIASAHARQEKVVAVEMLHDMPDPVGILQTMKRLAGDHGAVLVVDERAEETFTVPATEMERFFYTFSTLHCLAVSMQHDGVGTGTVIRPDTLRRYAADAGFSAVDVLDVEHAQFLLYRLR